MALIPSHYLNALASIDVKAKDEKGERRFISIATGLFNFNSGAYLGKTERDS